MGMSILKIGMSGLNAAQAGLVTTGHNISNASTAGFNRQQMLQSNALPQLSGSGFLGSGVNVTTVKRIYNDTLTQQLALAQSQGSRVDSFSSHIQQVANLLGDPSSGLTPRLQDMFSALADVASNPESISSRQALLSSAQALGASFQSLGQSLADMRSGINSEISASVSLINGFAQQIAGLNQSIVVAESGGVHAANDLRDQRDLLVAELNQQVRATVVAQSDGAYNIFVGNGQGIVLGVNAFALAATPSLHDPRRLELGFGNGASSALIAPESIEAGVLGGLFAFRSAALDPAQNALGRIAIVLARSFNEQHALGQDLYGALGGNFFSIAEPQVLASSRNTGNTGTGLINATLDRADALTTSDYRLQYNGAAAGNENFLLTRLSDGASTSISFASGGPPYLLNQDGFSLTLAAGAALNDSWMIQPTRLGASSFAVAISDPARIAAAAPIRSDAALGNRGNAIISAGNVSSISSLPLTGAVTLTYDAALGRFAVGGAVPAVAPVTYVSGGGISFNGLGFSISGTPSDGDVFTLGANTGGVGDNRNALALAALQTRATLGRNAAVPGAQASASFQGAYSQLVSEVGNTARQMAVTGKAQQNVITQTRQAQQSVSGVNLDEEAANLLRYQQAYQAAGKVMQVANTLFETVLNLGR